MSLKKLPILFIAISISLGIFYVCHLLIAGTSKIVQPSMERVFLPKSSNVNKDSILFNVLSDSLKAAHWIEFKSSTSALEIPLEAIDTLMSQHQLSDSFPIELVSKKLSRVETELLEVKSSIPTSDSLLTLLVKMNEAEQWTTFLNDYTLFKNYWSNQKLLKLQHIEQGIKEE